MSKKVEIEVGGKKLAVSNLEKVLYPKVGFTKGQLIDYYIRISPSLLPHLKNRPITLKRYPDGVEGLFFYEKRCPSHRPTWVKTTEVTSRREVGNTATSYDKTKAFARSLAERLERDHPEQVVSRMRKALRQGKVLIDWSQNDLTWLR